MAKLDARRITGFLADPPAATRVVLIYGDDLGLVRERADQLIRSVVGDDPFGLVEVPREAATRDAGLLAGEAAQPALTGGRRLVRVRDATDGLANAAKAALTGPGPGLVVLEAGTLAGNKGLRPALERANEAAAVIACYPESGAELEASLGRMLKERGVAADPAALSWMAARLGENRLQIRQEVEKLALYAHGAKQITAEDVRAVMGDESQARSESAFDAAGSGDMVRLDLELERLWVADTAPAQVLRGALGHFQRLMLAKEGMARGEQLDTVMRKFFPPIHFSRADSFKAQARNWNAEKLADALDLLLEAEGMTRTTAMPAEAITGRALFTIAALAKSR